MRFPIVLAGILVLVMAGLCFGQVTRTKPQPKPTAAPPASAADTSVANPAMTEMKFKPGLQFFTKKDGLQCLLDHTTQLAAAYAEAEGSGCKKVQVGQATLYNCGYAPSTPGYQKCLAAKEKIETILKNCGLTPPVHNPASDDGWDMNPVTPGCNSLGIACVMSGS